MGTPKGFANMSRKDVVANASKGGKASQAAGTGHRFTSEEAREAGRKGGRSPRLSLRDPKAETP